MFLYNSKVYSKCQWKSFCQSNGSYQSYLDYVKNHTDFSIPVYVEIKQSDIDCNPIYQYISNKLDFSGTLQICNPGYYVISENLTFNYNSNYLFMPTPTQTQIKLPLSLTNRKYNQTHLYPTFNPNGPYDLGFFAGIIIDGDNVCLTSNYKSLQMSKNMHLIQRFFALICLGSAPFITKKGPIDSGTDIKYPNNTIISHINFGLTSHHSILGNNTNNLCIKKCIFQNFETAAISLNNADFTTIHKNNIPYNNQNVPVNSDFFSFVSQTRTFVQLLPSNPTLNQITTLFVSHLQSIISQFQKNKSITDSEFINPSKLTDAISMGIFISQKGPSVEETGISCNQPLPDPTDKTENIKITNNIILNITANPIQTNAMAINNKPIILSHGKLYYNSNAYTQKQFLKWVASLSNWEQYKPYFMPTSLTPEIAQNLLNNPNQYIPYCNADIMNHLLKPVFGIRIQYTDNLLLKNNLVKNIKNVSKKYYCPPNAIYHPKTEFITGNDSVGILLSNTSSKHYNNKICNIKSNHGIEYKFINGPKN